ncbi:glycosyltransferase [Paludibaculum fermentans]|uniref:glycosyltransferase n=1 Tax=Paludibaculum fermentans TaxID=1473598 RepID=UPI003EBF9B40
MKIGLLTASLSTGGGGISEAVYFLGKHLQRTQEVKAFGLMDAGRPIGGGLPTVVCGVRGPRAFGYSPDLGRQVAASDVDILHAHGLWMYPSVLAMRWRRPRLVSPHGMLDGWALRNSHWKKWLARKLYESRNLREAACLHALNQQEAEAFRACGLRNPICVIPNGVEPPSTAPVMSAPWQALMPAGTRVLLYLGRLHPKKGIEALLRGWALARGLGESSSWRLVIAGWSQDGHDQVLQSLAHALGISAGVEFAGPQFAELKLSTLRAADAFILPSISEGLPMTVLEAWAHGLPVLMTDHCNLPSGFEAGAALRLEPSPESIAAQLSVLFKAPEAQLRAMGENGRSLVRRQFSWEKVAASMLSVYEWVLGRGPRPDALLWE